MKIVAFHIYNDFSGSPKVLSMVLKGLLNKGYDIDLLTSPSGGVLDSLEEEPCVRIYRHHYKFGKNPILQLLRYLYTQLYAFFFVFKYIGKKDVVLYLNTLMPLGAAVAGKLTRKRVVYHYHENANVKGAFYKMLAYFMQKLADEIICVSSYQHSFLFRKENVCVIPNALPLAFENGCRKIAAVPRKRDSVLMLSSLKLYKGVVEFIELASSLPQYKFELVINDTNDNIKSFIDSNNLKTPVNLTIWDRQANVLPFYERNSLVVNLSKKEHFVETFGLTALEAMSAGLPVIVPPVGGIAEMVVDGYNGYKIDVGNFDCLVKSVNYILSDSQLYETMRNNARDYASQYSNCCMIDNVENVIFDKK